MLAGPLLYVSGVATEVKSGNGADITMQHPLLIMHDHVLMVIRGLH